MINLGASPISRINLGSSSVSRAHIGASLAYSYLGFQSPVAIGTVGDSIVSNDGSLVEGKNLGALTDKTVNGVLFTGQFGFGQLTKNASVAGFYSDGNVSADFETILDSFSWIEGDVKTATISGLTIGQTYLLQMFVADSRALVNLRSQSYEIAGYASGPFLHGLQYSIRCRFVATATSEILTINAFPTPDVGASPNVNAFQVRQIS